MPNNVKPLIVDSKDGFLKNISELMEEYRNDNIQCCMLCYQRKDEGSTRTYFIGATDPHMFMTLERLKHDILGLVEYDAEIREFEDEDE